MQFKLHIPALLLICAAMPAQMPLYRAAANPPIAAAPETPQKTGSFTPGTTGLQELNGVNPDHTVIGAVERWWESDNCLHNGEYNPTCHIDTPVPQYPFGNLDVFDQIHRLQQHLNYAPNLKVRLPPGIYAVGATLQTLHMDNVTIDMSGSILVPKSPGVTAFTNGGDPKLSTTRNVHLIGGRFLKNSAGLGFDSYYGAYVCGTSAVDGLDMEPEEIAGTAGAGITIINVPQQPCTSEFALQHVVVRNANIHDTGGPSISIIGCRACKIEDNISANPSLAGPDKPVDKRNYLLYPVEPDNIELTGTDIVIRRNEVSGTPLWNDTPFSAHSPASAIYVAGADHFDISGNYIHDSKCTYDLCIAHGSDPEKTTTLLPNGGTSANYGYGPDAIHADTTQHGTVAGNRISGYSNAVVIEVSRNVSVTGNQISDTFGTALWDSSRAQHDIINEFNSTAGLVPGRGVTLATTRNPSAGCVDTCVEASIPANYTGVIFSEDSASSHLATYSKTGFPTGAIFPMMKTILSNQGQLNGYATLFLSPTLSCSDPNGITLPFPATGSTQYLLPIAQPYFFPLTDLQKMSQLQSAINGSRQQAFQKYCILQTKPSKSPSTLTLAGFRFQLLSASNLYANNTVENTGANALAFSGCSSNTLMTGNTIRNPGSYGDLGYIAYGFLAGMIVGSNDPDPSNCSMVAPAITNTLVSMDRPLSVHGNGYYTAVAIGGAAKDPPVITPILKDIVFTGISTPAYLHLSTNSGTPYLDLQESGNVGIRPPSYNALSDLSGEVKLAAGKATYPLHDFYTNMPRYSCTNETDNLNILCTVTQLSTYKWQLNLSNGSAAGSETVLFHRVDVNPTIE